jgi:NAD(P)-dependent dehydrogenase (short-subunit alcohol dehydrogenase family)
MDLQLDSKTALITGSTLGIGYAIAEALAREGATVIVNGRTQERVEQAQQRIRATGARGRVLGVVADLGTPQGAALVVKAFPDVDILVNNLGIFQPKPFEEIPDEDWLHFFEVNVMSGVRLSRAYLPGMRKRDWGRIIFVSSESGLQIPGEMIHYGMTKTAQIAIARGLAEITAGTDITVNTVLPGPTSSEGVVTFLGEVAAAEGIDRATIEGQFFDKNRPTSLIRRFITPAEVASMVAYVASPLASATTGAALRVEGGIIKSIA